MNTDTEEPCSDHAAQSQSKQQLDEQTENPKRGFSLLTFVLLFSIAAIGLSHVQTTYQLQKLMEKHERLEVLNSKLSDYEISASLGEALENADLRQVGDLVECTEAMLIEKGIEESSLEEIRSLLRDLGISTQ